MSRRVTAAAIPESRSLALSDEQQHYLGRVLRLAAESVVEVVDAAGNTWEGQLQFRGGQGFIDGLSRVSEAPASAPCILLAGLIKQSRWEVLLEKAVELGVTEIVPFEAARSVVKVSATKAEAKRARWERICDAAVRQSERGARVVVHTPLSLAAAIEVARAHGALLLHADEESPAARWPVERLGGPVAVVVGPEGGFTDAERALIAAQRGAAVGLGSSILRAETAALAALTAIRFAREGLLG